jgi:hypothetical protein
MLVWISVAAAVAIYVIYINSASLSFFLSFFDRLPLEVMLHLQLNAYLTLNHTHIHTYMHTHTYAMGGTSTRSHASSHGTKIHYLLFTLRIRRHW